MENDDVNINTIYNTSSKKKDSFKWINCNLQKGNIEKNLREETNYRILRIKYVKSVRMYAVYVERR